MTANSEVQPAKRGEASLRGRLAAATGLGALVVSLVAALLIGVAQWREESNSLPSAVEFEVFRLSEIEDSNSLALAAIGGTDGFALLLGAEAEVLATVGVVTDEIDELSVEVWANTTEQDLVFATAAELEGGSEMLMAGVACVDQRVCDTVVTGRSPVSLGSFLVSRLPWLILPSLAVGALALFGARWTVGRSLRPVEAMRSELAAITATSLDRRVPQPRTGDELERLASTLNDTLSRLQESTEATRRFAADAAHELRSPITGVRAAVELRAADDELLGQAVSELDRANRLIDDLLVLAKRQKAAPNRSDVDLDDLVRTDLAAARTRFPTVRFEQALEPARLVGDGDALRRIVSNVIDNAATHCTGMVRVEVTSSTDGHLVRVDDDGPGIAPSDRARVFERFARLDESRSRATGGSGLGLALVAELVADHGGTVTIDTAGLGGARFDVRLPNTEGAVPLGR